MDCYNLARIFGPTLVGHSTPSPGPHAIMEDTPRQCLVTSVTSLQFLSAFSGSSLHNAQSLSEMLDFIGLIPLYGNNLFLEGWVGRT